MCIRDRDKHFKNPQDNSPTIYRIDRIQNYKTLDRHFAQRYTCLLYTSCSSYVQDKANDETAAAMPPVTNGR